MKLRIENHKSELVEESDLKLSDKDTLLIRIPKHYTQKEMATFHNAVDKVLSSGGSLSIRDDIKFLVIRRDDK